ncbi:MAG: hypothetical protein IKW30_02980 [Lachnospiraceae bacterium]|nr:hypothetical protein [Lachnospiraceae bacterium]
MGNKNMDIFIIHSGQDFEKVKEIKQEICVKSKEQKIAMKVSLMSYDPVWNPTWKRKASKLMKEANLVLYIVGAQGADSKNIAWELKEAIKNHKSIVFYRLNEENELNKVLNGEDSFTQEEKINAKKLNNLDELYSIAKEYQNKEYLKLINEPGNLKKNLDMQIVLEQYKFFAETSEALVNRRQNVNSFYISANTALITIIATIFSLNTDWTIRFIITIVLALPGTLLNVSWKKILEAYGITNSSKLTILSELEKQLAISLYGAEWEEMSNEYNKKRYVSFTDSEKNLPRVFNILYTALITLCFAGLLIIFLKYKGLLFGNS